MVLSGAAKDNDVWRCWKFNGNFTPRLSQVHNSEIFKNETVQTSLHIGVMFSSFLFFFYFFFCQLKRSRAESPFGNFLRILDPWNADNGTKIALPQIKSLSLGLFVSRLWAKNLTSFGTTKMFQRTEEDIRAKSCVALSRKKLKLPWSNVPTELDQCSTTN